MVVLILKGSKGAGKKTQMRFIADKYDINFMFVDIKKFISDHVYGEDYEESTKDHRRNSFAGSACCSYSGGLSYC